MHYNYIYSNSTAPHCIATRKEDHIELTIAAPGIKKKDIQLKYSAFDYMLTVSAGDSTWKYPVTYRNIDLDAIEAKLDLGILTVRLPFKESDKVIKIT